MYDALTFLSDFRSGQERLIERCMEHGLDRREAKLYLDGIVLCDGIPCDIRTEYQALLRRDIRSYTRKTRDQAI